MMTRRMLALMAMLMVGCDKGSDAPAPTQTATTRTTVLPAPGPFGYEVSKDGRLAFSKLVDSKAAIFVSDGNGQNPKRVSFGVWDAGPLWSPDGKSIALSRDAGGQGDVVIVPADSGAEHIVAASSATEFPSAWLPDGSGLLFNVATTRGLELWVYNVADGRREKVFSVDGSVDGYPSPDGKWIASTHSKNGKSTVWLWDRQKKTHRQLTTEGFEVLQWGCFSPDSRSILYRSTRTGTGDVWRMDVATGQAQQLTQDVAEDGTPRWSPDGSRIVFFSNRGGQPDLWMLATGEKDVQRITDDAMSEQVPEWTPDGKALLVAVSVGQPHLYSLPIPGGAPVALTSGTWAINGATLSNDRTQIVYTGTKNGDEDVWVVPVTGGESRLVSGVPGYDGGAAWSPDGKQISFSSVRGGNFDIWIAPVSGGAATRLTDWPTNENGSQWSPDGKTIVFRSNRDSPGADLWTMPATGGTATRITKIGTVGSYKWSPDGKTIAYSAEVESSGQVFVVPATGGTPKAISPVTSLSPEWSPDGRELKVMQCDKGYCTTDIYSADGKKLRTLTTRKQPYEFDLKWSSNGSQVLVSWQDIFGDGGNRVDLRPAAGGSSQTLAGPIGFTMTAIGFSAGDKAAIVLGGPNGSALQRIAVPAPLKPAP